jgi:hypothetical protein
MTFTMVGGLELSQRGLGSFLAGTNVWSGIGLIALVGLFVWGIFFLLAVAAISARSSNRMLPLRVFITFSWAVFGIITGVLSTVVMNNPDPIVAWVMLSTILLSFIIAFVLAERENWTPRVRRSIPRSPLLRFLAWLLYTGSAGGVIWAMLMAVTTLIAGHNIVTSVLPAAAPGVRTVTELQVIYVLTGLVFYAWCYAMSGLFVRRLIAPRSVPLVGTTIGMLLLALGGSLPLFVAYFVYGPNWRFDTLPIGYVVANPFSLERMRPSSSDQEAIFGFLIVWSLLALVANLSWFRQQWRLFHRYERKPIPSPAAGPAEATVVHA